MGDLRLTIARRELGVLRAEKTIVLALLLQLFIAAFSSFLVVGLVSLYDPGTVDGYQVDVAVSGDAREDLMTVLHERPGLRGQSYDSRSAAMTAFERDEVDAVLDATHRGGRIHVAAAVPDSNLQTTLIVVQVRDALRAFERLERDQRAASLDATPLELPPEAKTSPYFSFTYTVLVPLLMFLPVFISGSIAVDSLTEEIDRGTLELLRVSPATLVDIVDGKLLAAAGLAPVQAGLWILLLRMNGTAVANPLWLVLLVASLATFVVGMGLALALLAPDRRAAQFLYSIGVLSVFGGTGLLPYNPTNAAARLAIDSAGPTTTAFVGAVALFATASVLAVRWLVDRTDPDGL